MKNILTILLCLLLPFLGSATTYYISNAGSTSNNGTSTSTPWPFSKVNSFTFASGDNILFNRGETFTGEIVVNQASVTYGAYGTGNKPIITGWTTVSAWTNLGSNIWESTSAVSTLPTLQMVSINGVSTPMGATPNRDATYPFLPNYFNIDSHTGTGSGTTTITSSSLTTNWTGADIVPRATHWILDKETITSQSGTTATYTGQASGITDGWGFFIQNDARTLDVQNEWYYNPSTKKIRIYSTASPTGVQITSIDTLLYANDFNNVTVDNLDFKGANTSALVFYYCQHTTVTNSNFSFTGDVAINGQNSSSYLDVENCAFSDLGSSGVWNSDGGSNWTIKNNSFVRTGLVSVIKPNDYANSAIQIYSANALVQYNTIDSTAYSGIIFRASGVQIRNNFINHTSILRDDGAGIYTGFTGETGKIIDGNIVLNSVGNSRGVGSADKAGNGIYLDDQNDSVKVTNNTVAHIVNAGIFQHIGRGANIHNNTVYDCGGGTDFTKGAFMVQSSNSYPSYQRNNNVTNNIFFQKNSSQFDVFFYEDTDGTNTISNYGTVDSNYYTNATSTTLVQDHPYNGTYNNLTFPGWQTASGDEAHGTAYSGNGSIDTTKIQFVYNNTKSSTSTSLGANYTDVKGNSYPGTISLAPYTSAVLIYSSALAAAPTISMSGDQSITTNSTSVFATPVWASGHSGTVNWTQASGPNNSTIGTPNNNSTTVSNLITGPYVYQCVATQDDNQTVSGTTNITVNIPTLHGPFKLKCNCSFKTK